MPYINKLSRDLIARHEQSPGSVLFINEGELNYKITKLVDNYIQQNGLSYSSINEVIGVLECAKLELYRQIAAPYEDVKKDIHGDVYTIGQT